MTPGGGLILVSLGPASAPGGSPRGEVAFGRGVGAAASLWAASGVPLATGRHPCRWGTILHPTISGESDEVVSSSLGSRTSHDHSARPSDSILAPGEDEVGRARRPGWGFAETSSASGLSRLPASRSRTFT